MAEAAASRETASVSPAYPWPAPDWRARRIYSFSASAIALALIGLAVLCEADWKVTACLVTLLIVIVLSYVVGATGEVWVRIFGALAAMRAGVSLTTTTTAASPSGASASSTTTTEPADPQTLER